MLKADTKSINLLFRFPLLKELRMHDQQAERFAIFFRALRVVRAVRAQDRAGVRAVELSEPFKAPMDVHVVDQKIRQSVQGNTHADKKHPPGLGHAAEHIAKSRRDGKYEKKAVIFFQKTLFFVFCFVMIGMPIPQQAVHHEFVREPSHEFHAYVSAYNGQGVDNPVCHIG